jgi:hypothetical protein
MKQEPGRLQPGILGLQAEEYVKSRMDPPVRSLKTKLTQ